MNYLRKKQQLSWTAIATLCAIVSLTAGAAWVGISKILKDEQQKYKQQRNHCWDRKESTR
jgi:hypothetical protein